MKTLLKTRTDKKENKLCIRISSNKMNKTIHRI